MIEDEYLGNGGASEYRNIEDRITQINLRAKMLLEEGNVVIPNINVKQSYKPIFLNTESRSIHRATVQRI